MPKKSASEVHEKIDESLRDYGEAFIRIVDDEVEIVHPDKVTVMTDEENRKVICVGKDVDTNVFAVLSSKESTLANLLKPQPYQESVMRALMEGGDDVSLWQPRRPSYLHEYALFGEKLSEMILPIKDVRIPHLKPGERLDMKKINYKNFAHTVEPVELNIHFDDQLSKILELEAARIADWRDRISMYTIAGRADEPVPGPRKEERKIIRLLQSVDRRQRKRGGRLFQRWLKERPGYNISRYNKD